MSFTIGRVEIWAGEVSDRPGELAQVLECLARAGVNLECAVLRPDAPLSNTGVLFVAPIRGDEEGRAAEKLGLRRTRGVESLRVFGPDHPGLLAQMARILAAAGLPLCGVTSAALGGGSVHYLRFDCEASAERALRVLQENLR